MTDNTPAIIQSTDKKDRISQTKTIYDVGAGEIFWRNFLAGFSRTLGGIILYLILLFIFGMFFAQFILPKFLPIINQLLDMSKSLEKFQQFDIPSKFPLP